MGRQIVAAIIPDCASIFIVKLGYYRRQVPFDLDIVVIGQPRDLMTDC